MHYSGRSAVLSTKRLLASRGAEKRRQKSADDVVGRFDPSEGLNMNTPMEATDGFSDIATDKTPEMEEPEREENGQYLLGYRDGVANVGLSVEEVHCKETDLMSAVIERNNMKKALRRVEKNQGCPGIDGMTVEELGSWLKEHWVMIRSKLLDGSYRPSAVKHVTIPKPDGGERMLGIPTVLDRLIQQAINQVLVPVFDPHFSETSYGFRVGRSAIDAVLHARKIQHEGKRWVVDLDLEKFFDYVNHDILMQQIQERVNDTILLNLIRKYLRAGLLKDGIESQRLKGTPQGGPLSPLLSNIMLDAFDKELEQRGHSFARYADDCNIYVQSKAAAERVLVSVSRWLEVQLKLKVNQTKSAATRPWLRKFLGYSVTNHKKAKLRIAPQSVKRFKGKVKELMRRGRGRNLKRFIAENLNPVLRGWINYYKVCETKGVLDELDSWIRHRLRSILWRQWKRTWTRRRKFMQLGLNEQTASMSASNQRGAWWNSGASHMNLALRKKYFDKLGLVGLQAERRFLEQIA